MPALPTSVLPKRIPHGPLKPSTTIQVSPLLLEAAGSESEVVLEKLHTTKQGLSEAEAEQFQTGWFVESLLTQTLIIHVIRANRIPFLHSWASWPLIVTTAVIMLLGAWLPFSPLGPAFGFTPLPPLYWPLLAVTLLGYVLLTQAVKTWLFRKGWFGE